MAGPFSQHQSANIMYVESDDTTEPRIKQEDEIKIDVHLGKFLCGDCGRCYKEPKTLARHFFSRHTSLTYQQCRECQPGRRCPRHNEGVKVWMPRLTKCSACSREFRTEKGLKEHKYKIHGPLAEQRKQLKILPKVSEDDLIAQQRSLLQQSRDRMVSVTSSTHVQNEPVEQSAVTRHFNRPLTTGVIVGEEAGHTVEITEDGKVNIHIANSAHISNNSGALPAVDRLSLSRDHRMGLNYILQPNTSDQEEGRRRMAIGFVLRDESVNGHEDNPYGYPELAALEAHEKGLPATAAISQIEAGTEHTFATLIRRVLTAEGFEDFICIREVLEILAYLMTYEELIRFADTIGPEAIADPAVTSDLTEAIRHWAQLKLLACRLSDSNSISQSPVRTTASTILHGCFVLEDAIARADVNPSKFNFALGPAEALRFRAAYPENMNLLDALAERAASRHPSWLQMTRPMLLKEILLYWEDLRDTVENLL